MASQHTCLTPHVSHAEAPIKEAQAFLVRTLPLLAQHDLTMAAACLRSAADIALDSVDKARKVQGSAIHCILPMTAYVPQCF